jgi:hypothetical protein
MLKRGMQTVKDLEHQCLRGIDAETWDRVPDLFGEIDLFDGTSMELPPTLCEWAETDPDASRIKMHLKLSGIDGRFQEAITRTLELAEEQDRSLEYFRSGSAGYQSDVPTCE